MIKKILKCFCVISSLFFGGVGIGYCIGLTLRNIILGG
jgi:hypothetical protein